MVAFLILILSIGAIIAYNVIQRQEKIINSERQALSNEKKINEINIEKFKHQQVLKGNYEKYKEYVLNYFQTIEGIEVENFEADVKRDFNTNSPSSIMLDFEYLNLIKVQYYEPFKYEDKNGNLVTFKGGEYVIKGDYTEPKCLTDIKYIFTVPSLSKF